MYLLSHMHALGCISSPCVACVCTCTLSAAGGCDTVCVMQDVRGDALCCEPLKLQGPVEIHPELGVGRSTAKGCLGEQQPDTGRSRL